MLLVLQEAVLLFEASAQRLLLRDVFVRGDPSAGGNRMMAKRPPACP
jgi:hypothetical protein